MARIASTSCSRRRLSTGRTCRQPTEACAYQVPRVPCLAKMSVSFEVYSARRDSGTAQSSTKETGLPSSFIDIMMLRPAVRTSAMPACSLGSSTSSTPPHRAPVAANEFLDDRLVHGDVARKREHGAVDQLDRNGVEGHDELGRLHRLMEAAE